MLCFARHKGESIIIDGNIRVTVYDISNLSGHPRVRIAVDAPPHISVNREEIQQCIDRDQAKGVRP
jgi:carbon storage regulator CsrA